MIVLIDNYDSFSYNVYQLVGSVYSDIRVVRNDAYTVSEIETMNPKAIILSPGPGRPHDAGICEELIAATASRIPILGICLGHQAICETYGARIGYAKELMHGKASTVTTDASSPLFRYVPQSFQAARYHSLAVEEDTLPACLQVIARSDDNEVMAVQHTTYPLFGVQFHPESILTPQGQEILRGFLEISKK